MPSFVASSAHRGLWLAQKMVPDTLNHAMFLWDVDGRLDTSVMASAFRHVLGEAEVLRFTFVDADGELRMVVRELGDWQPFFMDVSGSSDPEQAARDALAGVVGKPFDLERDLLVRLGVVTLAENRSLVVVAYHHLVSDGYGAAGLLSRRIAEVYTALARGTEAPPLPHPWNAEPYVTEPVRYEKSPKFDEDVEFWRGYLAGAPEPAQVPRVPAAGPELGEPLGEVDRWAELAGAIGMVSRTLTVPHAEAKVWAEGAKSLGVWMSSLVAAATAVLVRHRCDLPEFLMSLVVANRAKEAGRTPGLAVNVVPVRVRVPLAAGFGEIAEAVVEETYEILGHTGCHYSDIQRASGTSPSERGSFGVAVNVLDGVEQLDFAGSLAHHVGVTTGAFNELQIGVYTDGRVDSDLYVRVEATADLYTGEELRRFGAELIACLRAVAADPARPVGALDLVSGAERDRVLAAPNATQVPDWTVAELFAARVAETPTAAAVVSGDSTVSYRDLDERSSRLAEVLRHEGVGLEAVVAVALPRSVDLVVALLAVVKAGGAYLPVDPATPTEAVRSVAREAGVRTWLTDSAGAAAKPSDVDARVVLADQAGEHRDPSGGRVPSRPDNAMAVMYGGGSTAEVTGVAVTHRNVRRLVTDQRWRDGGRGSVLWHSPPTHDVFALELWVPLLNGGRVVVAPAGASALDVLLESRAAMEISALWLPAAQFLTIASEHPECFAEVREVWTGGGRVPATAVRRIQQACPGLAVVVAQGPVESTVFSTGDRLVAGGPATTGRPLDDTAVFVLGPGLAPVPAGVTGEMYVAGPGITRGYQGRAGQTAERFVPCPFGPAGGLMYRTGDRVRWGAGGTIEHVGRIGVPVRVRDVRVEPAEVEEVLSGHPGLAQSVVVVRPDHHDQQRIVAYVVPMGGRVAGGAGLSGEELRRFVAGQVPEFLVPSVLVELEHLPVTPGGRVDPTLLPDPEFGGAYRAPRTDTERVLAESFAEVLEIARVGIDDDFFELGGNSLRAIRLVGLIRTRLNIEVSIRTLFAARTIIGLSDDWEKLDRSSRPALRKRTRDGQVL